MPIKEECTKQVVLSAFENQTISSNTTTTGAIIDTAGYDNGVYFAIGCNAYTDGTYTMTIQEGDDSGLSDASTVTTSQLVYGAYPALKAAIAEGSACAKEAVFSTKRYLRMSIVSTGVTTGADVFGVAVMNAEIAPTDQD